MRLKELWINAKVTVETEILRGDSRKEKCVMFALKIMAGVAVENIILCGGREK